MLLRQRAKEWIFMLVKSSIAAVAVIAAVVSLSRVDYRELYDEMYPVNGLRRDVLHLCQDVKPTFVRALQTDRVSCYDSMPDPVEIAIGWVRTSSRLALMRRPTAVELAEKFLVEATMPARRPARAAPVHRLCGAAGGGIAVQADGAGLDFRRRGARARPIGRPGLGGARSGAARPGRGSEPRRNSCVGPPGCRCCRSATPSSGARWRRRCRDRSARRNGGRPALGDTGPPAAAPSRPCRRPRSPHPALRPGAHSPNSAHLFAPQRPAMHMRVPAAGFLKDAQRPQFELRVGTAHP